MQRDSVSLCVIPSHIGVAPHGAYIWTWSDRRSLRGVHEARVEHARHGDLPAGVMGMKATAGARRVRRDRTRIVKEEAVGTEDTYRVVRQSRERCCYGVQAPKHLARP